MKFIKTSFYNGIWLLNAVLAILIFGYFGMLEQYYCLSADDFSGIDYATQGIPGWGYASHFYWNWEGPFLSHFMHGLLMWSIANGLPPFVVLVAVKLGLTISNAALLTALSNRFNLGWKQSQTVFAALIYTLTLYLVSPNPTEIWHWLTGMLYLVPLIFLQLALAAMVSKRYLLAILPLAVVMQSRATYAVLIFGAITVVAVALVWKKSDDRKPWLVMALFSALFLAGYLLAPGNYVRMKEHGLELPFLISQFRIGLHNLFLSYNVAKMDRILLGLMAAIPILGYNTRLLRPKQLWHWTIPGGLYLFFAVAHETLFVYVTGYREWSRVLSLHAWLFLFTCCVYGYWTLGWIRIKRNRIRGCIVMVGVAGLLFRLFNGFTTEMELADQLKQDTDARLAFIFDHGQQGDTLYVPPIKYGGVLYFADFSDEPDHWINNDFTKAYDLDFKLATTDEKDEP